MLAIILKTLTENVGRINCCYKIKKLYKLVKCHNFYFKGQKIMLIGTSELVNRNRIGS